VEQKATVEEEAQEKEQGKITGRVTRRLFSIMSSRLVTKPVVGGREERGSQRERAIASGTKRDGGRETKAGQREQEGITGQVTRKLLPTMSSR
jgi:hypothetical protein